MKSRSTGLAQACTGSVLGYWPLAMGITGLLGRLEEVAQQVDIIEECHGKCVGVDAFVWLHALAVAYARDVIEEKHYDRLVTAFMRRARRFIATGIDLVFVFDGKPVPAKDATAARRRERRAAALVRAEGHGPESEEHRKALQAAVSIGPELVAAVLHALHTEGHRYLVAPYEADPQLRFLDRLGIIDYVLSVDSDMVALGVRRSLLKCNFREGTAMLYEEQAIFGDGEWEGGTLLSACQSAERTHNECLLSVTIWV